MDSRLGGASKPDQKLGGGLGLLSVAGRPWSCRPTRVPGVSNSSPSVFTRLAARGESPVAQKMGYSHRFSQSIFIRNKALRRTKIGWQSPFFTRTHFYHGLLACFSRKFRPCSTKPVVLVGADHRVGPLPVSTCCSVRICGKGRTSTLLGGHSGPSLRAPREKSGLAAQLADFDQVAHLGARLLDHPAR